MTNRYPKYVSYRNRTEMEKSLGHPAYAVFCDQAGRIMDLAMEIDTMEIESYSMNEVGYLSVRGPMIESDVRASRIDQYRNKFRDAAMTKYYLVGVPGIKKVIFNGPATIVIWGDGNKTVVKAQEGETIDHEKGLALAITKYVLGNKGNYYNTIRKLLEESSPILGGEK